MRAFGVVKSEAELDELAYELFEQEEVSRQLLMNTIS